MNSRMKLTLLALGLVIATAATTAGILRAATPQSQEEQEKMMKLYMEMAKPGKPHQELAALSGDWDITITTTCTGPEPVESKATCAFKPILGGRFVVQTMKGKWGEMPMDGFQILGYDNVQKKYVSVWMDNWSTGIHMSSGVEGANGVVEMKGLMKDAMSPEGRPFRSVMKPEGPDKFIFELYDTIQGQEVKHMESVYTRKGQP
jgi:hypothetical protein